jgi:hypothetical protein
VGRDCSALERLLFHLLLQGRLNLAALLDPFKPRPPNPPPPPPSPPPSPPPPPPGRRLTMKAAFNLASTFLALNIPCRWSTLLRQHYCSCPVPGTCKYTCALHPSFPAATCHASHLSLYAPSCNALCLCLFLLLTADACIGLACDAPGICQKPGGVCSEGRCTYQQADEGADCSGAGNLPGSTCSAAGQCEPSGTRLSLPGMWAQAEGLHIYVGGRG